MAHQILQGAYQSALPKISQRIILIFACIFTWVGAAQANGFKDALTLPALKTDKAMESLLLDITRTGDRIIAVGIRGHIVYSDDAGRTWKQADVPVSVTLTSVHFPSQSTGFAVGHDGVILRTKDQGSSWTLIYDGYRYLDLAIEAAQNYLDTKQQALVTLQETATEKKPLSDEIADLEAVIDEAQFKLEDTQFLKEQSAPYPLMDVWFKNDLKGYAVGAYGIFIYTEDGGDSWQSGKYRVDNPGDLHYNQLLDLGESGYFMVGEAGTLYRSTDSGQTFEKLLSPYEGTFFGALWDKKNSRILAFGLRGSLYQSLDLGDNWQQIEVPRQVSLNGASINDDQIYIVGNAGLVVIGSTESQEFTTYTSASPLPLTGVLVYQDRLITIGQGGVEARSIERSELSLVSE